MKADEPTPQNAAQREAEAEHFCTLIRIEGSNTLVLPTEHPHWLPGVIAGSYGAIDVEAQVATFEDTHGFVGAFMAEWDRRRAEDVRRLRSGLFACPDASGEDSYFEITAMATAGPDQLRIEWVGSGTGSVNLGGGRDQINWLRRAERAQKAAARLMSGGDDLPSPPPLLFLTLSDDGTVHAVDAPPRCSVPVEAGLELPAPLAEVLPLRMAEQILAHARLARANEAPRNFELTRQAGKIDRVHRVRVEPQEQQRLRAVIYDISERAALRRHLDGLAVTDQLTGTANRTLLVERLTRAVGRCQRYGRRMGVLTLDVDHLGLINERYGRAAGDEVLRESGRRLNTLLRSTDTLARWENDTFVFVIEEVTEFEDAEIVAQKMLALFDEPVTFGVEKVPISASIGVSIYPDHAASEQALIETSRTALEHARGEGTSGYCLVGQEPEFLLGQRQVLRQEFDQGMEDNEFQLVFQPVCRVSNRSWVGAEAYVRWAHPKRGLLLPNAFLRAAEASGSMHRLDRHVVGQALANAARWPELSQRRLTVAVNLARQTLRQTDLTVTIAELLQEAGVDPHCLEIEISEKVFASAGRPLYRKLRDLRRLGVRLAIDEFGTGTLSLRALRQLEPDRIKIDHQFVSAASRSREGERFCSAILGMAHGFGAEVVAQGVESPDDEDLMRSLGCEFLQGYRLARPMSAEDFEQRIWDQVAQAQGTSSRRSD